MRKMTRMFLIGAVLATSGLTAKIATENYKAIVTRDERIHKAYENAKKPNKTAVLEAIVDATDAESEERIQNAVVLEPEEPSKTPKVVRVTTSAGVSPISSVMDKKTINKAEEFIEKVAHPANVTMNDILDFTTENIPVQELVYETKDIFPTFEEQEEEEAEKPLTYKITLPNSGGLEIPPGNRYRYFFNVGENDGKNLNCIDLAENTSIIAAYLIVNKTAGSSSEKFITFYNAQNYLNSVMFYFSSKTIDYNRLEQLKDNDENLENSVSFKGIYDFLVGVETGKYPLLTGIY